MLRPWRSGSCDRRWRRPVRHADFGLHFSLDDRWVSRKIRHFSVVCCCRLSACESGATAPVILEDFPHDPPNWSDMVSWQPPDLPAIETPDSAADWQAAHWHARWRHCVRHGSVPAKDMVNHHNRIEWAGGGTVAGMRRAVPRGGNFHSSAPQYACADPAIPVRRHKGDVQ